MKYHAERSNYPFHPGVGIFSFRPAMKGTCILKICIHALLLSSIKAKSCLFRRGEIKFSVTRELLNYPRSEFSPCLQGKGEIWVGARFHFG